MTREEAYNRIDAIIAKHEIDDEYVTITSAKDYDALRLARKLLEQEPCEDAISRQAVIDMATTIQTDDFSGNEIIEVVDIDDVKGLPPVTPQPKTGHWIEHYDEDGCGELYSHWVCSECGRSVGFNLANIEDVLRDYPYCHCGAKMVEPQESEVSE